MHSSTPFILLLLLSVLSVAQGQCLCPSDGTPVCCQPSRGPARIFPNACECTCVPGNIMLPSSACPLPSPTTAPDTAAASATTPPAAAATTPSVVARTPPPVAARTPPPQAPRTLVQFFISPCALLRCPRGNFCTSPRPGEAVCKPIPSSGSAQGPVTVTGFAPAATDAVMPMPTPDALAAAATADPDMPDFSEAPEASPDFAPSCVCTRELNEVCCQTDTGLNTLPNPCTCGCFNGTIVSRNSC